MIVFYLVTLLTVSSGKIDVKWQLYECAEIKDRALRLSCFDLLVTDLRFEDVEKILKERQKKGSQPNGKTPQSGKLKDDQAASNLEL